MQVDKTAYNVNYIRIRCKRFGVLLLLLYLFALGYLTLFTYNRYIYGQSFNLALFDSILLMWRSGNLWLMFKNIIGNVLLFMPLGFLVPLLFRKCRGFFTMLVISCGTSVTIEVLQYEYAKRIFDIDDILLNVVGALAGYILFQICVLVFRLIVRAKRRT